MQAASTAWSARFASGFPGSNSKISVVAPNAAGNDQAPLRAEPGGASILAQVCLRKLTMPHCVLPFLPPDRRHG